MRAIVVYESLWGNTEKLVRAVAAELSTTMEVEVVDAEAAPASVEGFDLVVVGGPTHAFSMSRASTRASAATDKSAPHVPTRGIREWLDALAPAITKVPAAAFDTRVDTPRMPGSAAKAARQELRSHGFDTAAKAKTFRVHGYEGPVVDGELEASAVWARELAALVAARA